MFLSRVLVVYLRAIFVFLVLAAIPALVEARANAEVSDPAAVGDPVGVHISADRNGVIETRDGLTLHLSADLGSVRIIPLEAGAPPVVRYSLHLETDARTPLAQHLLDSYSLKAKATTLGVDISGALPPPAARGVSSDAQFWVQFEVSVPQGFSVEVKTEAGDIETQDIGGAATLVTQGGNIRTGRIGVAGLRNASLLQGGPTRTRAKLQTEGGHIQVLDVEGDLVAFTGGGHISAGNVSGDASLHTGGGHIRAGKIGGRADLETDGGNVTVGQAAGVTSVRTGGGQIDFGEVHGSVRAQTGGGGIRIMYVSGPMEVESSGGSICLTRVAGAVQAATADGTITAWINPDPSTNGASMVQLQGASQLASGNGDLIVFLPRNLAANIEAMVTAGDERRIEADPALHLAMQKIQTNGSEGVHATSALNGGGTVLKLRTSRGKIRLQFLDSDPSLRESRIREQRERLRVVEVSQPSTPVVSDTPMTAPGGRSDWLESWIDKLEIAVNGGLREDADDFQKRLTSSPHPSYPALAQRVGIQGFVKLQVRVTKDGRVEVVKLLQGEPVLADAAITAVKQWRAQPAWINGKQAEVVSTVTFNFQLH